MNPKYLRDQLRDHYRAASLPVAAVRRFLALVEDDTGREPNGDDRCEQRDKECELPGSSEPFSSAETHARRQVSRWPAALIFLIWLLCSGAWSAWEDYSSYPDRLVGRFDYYLTRWNVNDAAPTAAQIAPWVSELRSDQPIRRWRAAAQLGDCAAEAATPALIAALYDETGTQRTCQIAHNLGRIGARKALPALIESIDHPTNMDLRVCAAMALGDIGDPRALDPLIRAYRNRGSLAALDSVAYLGDPRAKSFLEGVARSAPVRMHRLAAQHGLLLLGLLRDADPVKALLGALPALPQRSQTWAIARLVAESDPRAIGPLHRLASDRLRPEELRICATAALATFGSRAESEIRSLAGMQDELMRVIGGLAVRHIDRPALASTTDGKKAIEAGGLMRVRAALTHDGELNR